MAQKRGSYLDQLKFDPKLLTSFKAKYLTNIRVVILLVIIILVAGISSFLTLPRRLNPEVKIPIVGVSTVLPGASPQDVESLVTIPLEESLGGVKGISKVDSVSSESFSMITVEFESSVDPKDAQDDVTAAINKVNDLPEDAQDPSIAAFDFEDQAVWTFALTTDSDFASLQTVAKTLDDKLSESGKVDRVMVTGLEENEIQVLVKPEAIATYGVNPIVLSQLVSTVTSSFPAGNVITSESSYPVGINSLNTISDLRKTRLNLNGQVVTLSDIAEIVERPKPNQAQAYYADNKTKPTNVVSFSVFKTSGTNIEDAVKEAQQIADDTLKPYHNQFKTVTVSNFAEDIDVQFGDLLKNFRDTIILVFIVFIIFLGLRQAIIASLTIPLTFLVTFAIMQMAGLSLNFLSMFSLLLALGLLVDDTIVVVTGITAYYRTRKFTPVEAGLITWRDFIIPIWSTTITTVWAFVPLLLATGIIGEFIKTIPIVVTAALYASTAIAVLITLPLMMVILKFQLPRRVKILVAGLTIVLLLAALFPIVPKGPLLPLIYLVFIVWIAMTYYLRRDLFRNSKRFISNRTSLRIDKKRISSVIDHGLIDMRVVANKYGSIIERILSSKSNRRKTIVIVVIFTVFSYLLLPLGFVKNEFFPKSDSEILYINFEMPAGSNLENTTTEGLKILEKIRHTEGATYVTMQAGSGIDPAAFSPMNGENLALFNIVLPDLKKQETGSLEIAEKLREDFKNWPTGKVSVVEQSGGPPAGADVQISFSGDDLQQLDQIADKTVAFLEKQDGIINADKSIPSGTSKLVFNPDRSQMAEAGVGIEQVGMWLRMYNTGFPLDSVKFGKDSQDVTMRVSQDLQSPEGLTQISIPTQTGSYPITSLGNFKLETNPTRITRTESKRTITVAAGVTAGQSVTDANKKLTEFVKNDLDLPAGYTTQTGGVNDENQKSVNSIMRAMILAAILILATMVIQFRSYRKAVVVMMVIPLAISGVFILFALSGTPLSFPALIGVLALFGIVVNNSMMLVDKIGVNLKAGLKFKDAIVDAGAARLEPIFLGSLCTIVGLIPITLSDPLWRGLGGAIIAGLTFSGIIMLLFIPVVYYIWFREAETIESRRKSLR